MVTFDGSLTGGGATLQVGVKDRAEIHTKPIIAYWADRWGPADFALMQTKPGDRAGQAKCEALTLLLSLTTWQRLLAHSQGALTFVGDAMGVLPDALRLKTREPILNGIIGELALQLAPMGADIRAAHIWSERNVTCDALSRLQQGDAPDLPLLREAIAPSRTLLPRQLGSQLLPEYYCTQEGSGPLVGVTRNGDCRIIDERLGTNKIPNIDGCREPQQQSCNAAPKVRPAFDAKANH